MPRKQYQVVHKGNASVLIPAQFVQSLLVVSGQDLLFIVNLLELTLSDKNYRLATLAGDNLELLVINCLN